MRVCVNLDAGHGTKTRDRTFRIPPRLLKRTYRRVLPFWNAIQIMRAGKPQSLPATIVGFPSVAELEHFQSQSGNSGFF